jgi:hypothetical protein
MEEYCCSLHDIYGTFETVPNGYLVVPLYVNDKYYRNLYILYPEYIRAVDYIKVPIIWEQNKEKWNYFIAQSNRKVGSYFIDSDMVYISKDRELRCKLSPEHYKAMRKKTLWELLDI